MKASFVKGVGAAVFITGVMMLGLNGVKYRDWYGRMGLKRGQTYTSSERPIEVHHRWIFITLGASLILISKRFEPVKKE